MYIDHDKKTVNTVILILELAFGLLVTPVIGFFTLGVFLAARNVDEYLIAFLVFLPLFLLGVLLIVLSIRRMILADTVTFCNKIFENDPDGEVEIDEILARKGRAPRSSYAAKIEKLYDKGFFKNLTYDKKYRYFELTDKIKNVALYNRRFIGINCPGCAAPLKIRKGYVVVCDRCGAGKEF